MQPQDKILCVQFPDRYSKYLESKRHLGGECKREVFFEQEDRGKNIRELTQNPSQGYRLYDPDGIAVTQASNAGGVGAKTGLYAVNINHGELKIQDEQISNCIDANFHKGFDNHGQRTGVIQ